MYIMIVYTNNNPIKACFSNKKELFQFKHAQQKTWKFSISYSTPDFSKKIRKVRKFA